MIKFSTRPRSSVDRVSASGAEERSSSLRGGALMKPPHGGFVFNRYEREAREVNIFSWRSWRRFDRLSARLSRRISSALQFMRDEKVCFNCLAGDSLRGVQFFCGCDRSGRADRVRRHFDFAALADLEAQ